MQSIGIIIAIVGGTCAWCKWSVDRFMLPEVVAASAGVLLLWMGLAWSRLRGRGEFRMSLLGVAILPFLLSCMVSTFTSIDRPMSILGVYMTPMMGLLQLGLLALLCHGVAECDLDYRVILGSLLVVSAVLNICAIAEHLGAWKASFGRFLLEDGTGRVSSIVGNPIFLGAILAGILPVMLQGISLGGWWARAAVPLLAMTAWTIYMTRSRGAVLGALVAACIYGLVEQRARITRRMVAAGALGLLMLLTCAVFITRKPQSDNARLEIWRIAARSIVDRGPLGSGPDTFLLTFRKGETAAFNAIEGGHHHFSAHNDFLQVASTVGVVGLLAYLVGLVVVVIILAAAVRASPEVGTIACASIGALFFLAKFCPLPFSCMVVGAVMLGLAAREQGSIFQVTRTKQRAYAVCMVTAAALLMGVNARRIYADAWYMQGIRLANAGNPPASERAFSRAADLNPWEQKYSQNHARALSNISLSTQVMDDMLRIAQENIIRHPNDPDAYQAYARALAVTYMRLHNDALPFALQSIERARVLAPQFHAYTKFSNELSKMLNGRVVNLPDLDDLIKRGA